MKTNPISRALDRHRETRAQRRRIRRAAIAWRESLARRDALDPACAALVRPTPDRTSGLDNAA